MLIAILHEVLEFEKEVKQTCHPKVSRTKVAIYCKPAMLTAVGLECHLNLGFCLFGILGLPASADTIRGGLISLTAMNTQGSLSKLLTCTSGHSRLTSELHPSASIFMNP